MSGTVNTHFDEEDPTWTQATPPVKNQGQGFRSAVQLAPSAYLASAVACSELVCHILPPQESYTYTLSGRGQDNVVPGP